VSREVRVDLLVTDQLPVYDVDGITKVAGLTTGDFGINVYANGVLQVAHPVTLSEIGAGEYKVEFTPDAVGFWVLVVKVLFSGAEWQGEYEVVKATLLGVA
jgi:hypothetical protein